MLQRMPRQAHETSLCNELAPAVSVLQLTLPRFHPAGGPRALASLSRPRQSPRGRRAGRRPTAPRLGPRSVAWRHKSTQAGHVMPRSSPSRTSASPS